MVATLAGLYFFAVRLNPRAALQDRVRRPQVLSFVLGITALWVASDWPVHDLAETSMYSVHMVQHLLLTLVAPPLLLMGTPAWLLRSILTRTRMMSIARKLTRPFPAFIIFNAVVVVTHWPELVDVVMRHHPLHFVTHAALVMAALIMWTPVVSPLLELPRLSYPARMFYLFLQSILPTVPASFLTFADSPLYRFYVGLPKLWGMTALADQQVAGLVMKIGGGFILWGVIAVLFFKWHALEEREGIDLLQWRDVERQLDRTEPVP